MEVVELSVHREGVCVDFRAGDDTVKSVVVSGSWLFKIWDIVLRWSFDAIW